MNNSTATKKRTARARRAKATGRARATKKTGDLRSKPDRGRETTGGPAPSAATRDGRPLSGKAIRHLRALGHHLTAIIQIGKDGLTDAIVAATREALLAHELVKVRIASEAPVERKEAAADLASRAGATLAQVLGRTLLLYKRHPRTPKLVLPR